jgi:cob(I)alamin adenosyltransferase
MLSQIQHQLFEIGSELAIPGHACINSQHILQLEHDIDELNAPLPPLKEFILPGGSQAASYCHLARAICRRAERQLIALNQVESCSELSRRYLNRLSDLLFVMCRTINIAAGYTDVYWQSKKLSEQNQ